jgi:hypothetical protein
MNRSSSLHIERYPKNHSCALKALCQLGRRDLNITAGMLMLQT